jgi:hypothetical protein
LSASTPQRQKQTRSLRRTTSCGAPRSFHTWGPSTGSRACPESPLPDRQFFVRSEISCYPPCTQDSYKVKEIGIARGAIYGRCQRRRHASQKHLSRAMYRCGDIKESSEFVLDLAWPIHQSNESMLRDRFKKCVGQRSLRERECRSWTVEALRTG